MATGINTYQCPACTGPLHFVGDSGNLECDYCGSSFTVSEIESLYAEKEKEAISAQEKRDIEEAKLKEQAKGPSGEEWNTSELNDDWGEDGNSMKAYNCPSCGAELICDSTTAATSCPYCGNPTVIPSQFKGVLKPDLVIPFKLNQKAAESALLNHYKGKILLPKEFTSQNKIKEIKGVYVPFWLFDGEAFADMDFVATRIAVARVGDDEVTTTSHYKIERSGTIAFEKIPVDGSSKMPNEYMDSIEPFNYDEIKPFSTAYLPGYLADKYDETAEECSKRADERAYNTAISAIRQTVSGYNTCNVVNKNVRLKRGKVHYGLLPVYMLSTKWGNESYLFAMNGQTGKMVGSLPVSMSKFWTLFFIIGIVLTIIFTPILYFLLG